METTLALRGSSVLATMDDVERAATAMSKSGYFQDAREAAQSVVKILAGQEMGFGPFASMTGIYIIQGRPSVGANLMAAAVKRSGRYNYRVIEMTDAVCEIAFFEGSMDIGHSKFTLEDARKAGTKNLDKFARNMLFARAMSNGCRWYCPDIFAGAPTYTPEELGANVNEAGEVIDILPTLPSLTKPTPSAQNNGGDANGQQAPVMPQEARSGAQDAENVKNVVAPVDDAKSWNEVVLDALAQDWNLAKPRLMETLKYCTMPKDSPIESMRVWMKLYKTARNKGQTPAIAAATANEVIDFGNQ